MEEEVRKYWWERNRKHLDLIDERVKSLKNDPQYQGMKKGDLIDRVAEDLNREIYPQMIERLKEEYQWIYEDELSFIEKKRACGLTFLIWLVISRLIGRKAREF